MTNMQLRQHQATLARQAAVEMGDAVIGIVLVYRGYDTRVRPINGRWSATIVLEDIGNDHADVIEEWGDTWEDATMKASQAADAALPRPESAPIACTCAPHYAYCRLHPGSE